MYLPFVAIENDAQAEDLICKIRESEEERDRLISVCLFKVAEYNQKIETYRQVYEKSVSGAMALLGEYCRNKANHSTKTLISYELPSGKLQWKKHDAKVIKDDKALLKWIDSQELDFALAYVKTERKPDWEALKKIARTIGNNYVIDGGEIIEGVCLEDQPDTFEVK